MKKIIFYIGLTGSVLFLGVLIFSSCKKDPAPTPTWTYDGSMAPLNNAKAESAFTEMPNMSSQAMSGTMVYYKSDKVNVIFPNEHGAYTIEKAACNVNIIIDTSGTEDTLIVDWGTSNCTCNDGKTRRGKIITTWTGSYYNQGTVITHTPVDYYVNDNKVEGVMTVENMGNNAQGQPYYNIQINGVVTMTTGEIINYTSTRVRTFTNGYATQWNFMDDEYDVTGTATGNDQNNNGWTTNVTSPIHVKVGCPYITKGVVDITPTNLPTRTIDYGAGACDATFTITISGHTYTISIY
jgi:hypothetical protein